MAQPHATVPSMLLPVLLILIPQSVVLAPMHMSRPSRSKEHLNSYHNQDRCHGNQTCHGRISLVPEMGETWIREGHERCWKEMNEGGRNEHTCTEVSRKEEEVVGYRQSREATHDDRERACCMPDVSSKLAVRDDYGSNSPRVLSTRMMKRAATCSGVLYDPRF